eukprot:scaffold318_cov396-Prasinococcus_capsulatus_cf.AAC.27
MPHAVLRPPCGACTVPAVLRARRSLRSDCGCSASPACGFPQAPAYLGRGGLPPNTPQGAGRARRTREICASPDPARRSRQRGEDEAMLRFSVPTHGLAAGVFCGTVAHRAARKRFF